MAVKIRLKRLGRRKRPFFRLVAIDSRSRRDGAEIERLGWYDPLVSEKDGIQLNEERIFYWLKSGAQPTKTVNNLFTRSGINLKWHLMREGKTEAEIQSEIERWRQQREDQQRRREAEEAQKKRDLEAEKKTETDIATESVSEEEQKSDETVEEADMQADEQQTESVTEPAESEVQAVDEIVDEETLPVQSNDVEESLAEEDKEKASVESSTSESETEETPIVESESDAVVEGEPSPEAENEAIKPEADK